VRFARVPRDQRTFWSAVVSDKGDMAMVEGVAFVDGQYGPASEAKVSILEPTFTKSDLVYDTISIWKGLFFRLDDHMARFARSCDAMQLNPPYSTDEMKRIAAECVDRAGFEDACVTFMATRGPFSDFANRDLRTCTNGLMVLAVPYYYVLPKDKHETGVNAIIGKTRRVPAESIDARVKNFNWMDLTRGMLEAYEQGGDTVVLCTPDGLLAEGYGFNIWLVKDGVLKTPRGNLLEGVTRASVFDIAREAGVTVEETALTEDDLRTADEAR
jgi:branched-chain amino acid aminotransferase